MNYNLAILGFIEIFSALSIGIVMLAFTFKIMEWVGRRFYNILEFNLAYSIFTMVIMLSVGIMIGGILQPLISSFRLLNRDSDSFVMAFGYLATGALYIAIAYSATVIIALVSTFMYSKLTPIDEFDEIRKNNLGVALILSSIVITLTLLSKDGVITVIEALVPYPKLPVIGQ